MRISGVRPPLVASSGGSRASPERAAAAAAAVRTRRSDRHSFRTSASSFTVSLIVSSTSCTSFWISVSFLGRGRRGG
jgi:hypothetical protein